ncbi:MAG: hypothetical protein AMK72_08115 [Planctomycetes bacterium SM23_25]|nr:MAG: hypothetical protein AMK72_08115 [Planctomycetes bacterium SM23_25]
MRRNRCAAKCSHGHPLSRRAFLGASAWTLGSAVLTGCGNLADRRPAAGLAPMKPCGPASTCVPTLRAAFVRRKGPYGMRWPGAVYDGEAARAMYTKKIRETAESLGMKLDLRPEPIFSSAEADAWVAECRAAQPDGLLVVLLDRQQHAWPTANKAIDSGIPTVIYSPVGSSFTTNTAAPSKKPGCVIYSTDDAAQLVYGMKMIHARTKMRAARCIVLRGGERRDTTLADLGIALRYVPAKAFLDEYQKTAVTDEVRAMAEDYIRRARRVTGASRDDVINGVKGYVVARTILEREEGDAITMDCLGALGRSQVSLPCIAWSRMNDSGLPAACEADLGAVATHIAVQYLFDRPGFQQDPVAETSQQAIIGAHCTCATRLEGFDQPPEPFDIRHHHGNRDAVPRTLWRIGHPVTSADILPGKPSKMLIASGRVLKNVDVPPAGGCVVSVMVRFDNVDDVLAWPGFHQIFFYGNYKRHLMDFCRLSGIEPEVV